MPVPSILRNALIEAMGGWGPFTVREIEGLFDDHGFEATADVEPQQGVRRTTAAEHLAAVDWDDANQRQRLLQLADDVLTFYPQEPQESAVAPGRRLRRAVTRIREGGEAEPAGEVEAPFDRTLDPDDPYDVWPEGRIRLFFSHTSNHKEFVSLVAAALETWPFACFIAHEEIEPSLAWQEVIEASLRSCHALVAFISEDFRASAWCDQEVGWALGRELVVIPVRLDRDPHGLLGAIQGVPGSLQDVPGGLAARIATAMTTAVFRQTRPGSRSLVDPLADAVVRQFCASPTSDLAVRRFDFVRRLPLALWTPERKLALETAMNENAAIGGAQVADGRVLREALADILR